MVKSDPPLKDEAILKREAAITKAKEKLAAKARAEAAVAKMREKNHAQGNEKQSMK